MFSQIDPIYFYIGDPDEIAAGVLPREGNGSNVVATQLILRKGANPLTDGIAAFDIAQNTSFDNSGMREAGTATSGVSVVNAPGLCLPETGGTGTTGYYIAGCLVIVLTSIVFISRKKKYSL